jgi:hypothetical protein
LVAADAGKAAPRTIPAKSATFVLLNIFGSLVELRGLNQNGLTVPANTGRALRRSIRTMTMADAWIDLVRSGRASGIDRRKICSRKYFGSVQQHILMCRGTKSSLATKDEARRIAVNMAKLRELLRRS